MVRVNENGRVDGGLMTVKLPIEDVVTPATVIEVDVVEYTDSDPMYVILSYEENYSLTRLLGLGNMTLWKNVIRILFVFVALITKLLIVNVNMARVFGSVTVLYTFVQTWLKYTSYISDIVIGPNGCNDHGFFNMLSEICTVEDERLADTRPSVMLIVCEVIGDWMPQLSPVTSVPYIYRHILLVGQYMLGCLILSCLYSTMDPI